MKHVCLTCCHFVCVEVCDGSTLFPSTCFSMVGGVHGLYVFMLTFASGCVEARGCLGVSVLSFVVAIVHVKVYEMLDAFMCFWMCS